MRYALLVMVCSLSTGLHGAQPPIPGGEPRHRDGEPPRHRERDASGPREIDPERERAMLKARLESRLAESRQIQERLESALQRLEEGAPLAAVRADLELPGEREFRRPLDRHMGPGGPGPGSGSPPHGRREIRRLSDEERERFVVYIQQHAPDLATRMSVLREEHPSMADRMLARMEPRLRLLMAEEDSRLRDLRRQELRAGWDAVGATRALAESIRSGEDEQTIARRAQELRAVLGEHFDIRQAMQEREIAMFEGRLAELRQEMEEHLASRDRLVDQRVEAVIRAMQQRSESEEKSEGGKPNLHK